MVAWDADVRADLAQRRVEQMRRGVIATGGIPRRPIDDQTHGRGCFEGAPIEPDAMAFLTFYLPAEQASTCIVEQANTCSPDYRCTKAKRHGQ